MESTVTTIGVGTASAVPDAVALTVAVQHRADSVGDAQRLAADDPLVHAGAAFTVRRWTRTF